MTVRIHKPGMRPETRRITATCRNCQCEFSFNPPDAQFNSDQREGDFLSIACPTCGDIVTVSDRPSFR